MNFSDLARDYLRRADSRRAALTTLHSGSAYADVVRECQEVTELLLKGALRFVGVDPPKRHDVGPALKRHLDRFPQSWQDAIDRIVRHSAWLLELRSLAFYGDEETGRPASELFDREEAEKAMGGLDELLDLYRELVAGEKSPAPGPPDPPPQLDVGE
ncbi:MAG: HEPN domain-containing protein [Gemmatimonadota bacterium]